MTSTKKNREQYDVNFCYTETYIKSAIPYCQRLWTVKPWRLEETHDSRRWEMEQQSTGAEGGKGEGGAGNGKDWMNYDFIIWSMILPIQNHVIKIYSHLDIHKQTNAC